MHLNTWELAARVSGEGADGPVQSSFAGEEDGEVFLPWRCLELTIFQSEAEGEDGEVLEVVVLVAVGKCGVFAEDAGGVVVGGGVEAVSTEMLELRTILWALTGRSSLGARVTSLMSTATLFPLLDERS